MLEDREFDVVITCLTLHHMETDEEIQALFNGAYRVLKPGGALLVNHLHREQVDSYWFLHLCPRVRAQ